MLKSNKGFTLIEMLIVLTIISVLIILIVPNLSTRSESVHDTGCEALVSVVESQVALYHLENGDYPETLAALAADDYITEDQTTCSNGQDLNYTNTDGSVSVPTAIE
ncbi:competence type IV pilus major pilin ComGC [Virgibacillus xinjiangensis]|uniref:ComG operon protein 3 n=1 Tax=Virgibacillus xinjiangensis TaxID=393090 RepID=A0ABV7CRS2_9BACI